MTDSAILGKNENTQLTVVFTQGEDSCYWLKNLNTDASVEIYFNDFTPDCEITEINAEFADHVEDQLKLIEDHTKVDHVFFAHLANLMKEL